MEYLTFYFKKQGSIEFNKHYNKLELFKVNAKNPFTSINNGDTIEKLLK
jgi:hypothetical protein